MEERGLAAIVWKRHAPEIPLRPLVALAYQFPLPAKEEVARLVEQDSYEPDPELSGEAPEQAGIEADGLWIEAIEIQNFRLFRSAAATFRASPSAPIVLIEAPNGEGKSTIIMAVQHALGLIDTTAPGDHADHIVYKYAEREPVDVKVTLRFRTAAGRMIEVTRIGAYRRNFDGHWVRQREEDVIVSLGGEVIRGADAERWLHDTFPPTVADFFVFDAENSKVVAGFRGESGRELPSVREHMDAILGL